MKNVRLPCSECNLKLLFVGGIGAGTLREREPQVFFTFQKACETELKTQQW